MGKTSPVVNETRYGESNFSVMTCVSTRGFTSLVRDFTLHTPHGQHFAEQAWHGKLYLSTVVKARQPPHYGSTIFIPENSRLVVLFLHRGKSKKPYWYSLLYTYGALPKLRLILVEL